MLSQSNKMLFVKGVLPFKQNFFIKRNCFKGEEGIYFSISIILETFVKLIKFIRSFSKTISKATANFVKSTESLLTV